MKQFSSNWNKMLWLKYVDTVYLLYSLLEVPMCTKTLKALRSPAVFTMRFYKLSFVIPVGILSNLFLEHTSVNPGLGVGPNPLAWLVKPLQLISRLSFQTHFQLLPLCPMRIPTTLHSLYGQHPLFSWIVLPHFPFSFILQTLLKASKTKSNINSTCRQLHTPLPLSYQHFKWPSTSFYFISFFIKITCLFPVFTESRGREAVSSFSLYLCSRHTAHMHWVFGKITQSKSLLLLYSCVFRAFFAWPYELFKQQDLRENGLPGFVQPHHRKEHFEEGTMQPSLAPLPPWSLMNEASWLMAPEAPIWYTCLKEPLDIILTAILTWCSHCRFSDSLRLRQCF